MKASKHAEIFTYYSFCFPAASAGTPAPGELELPSSLLEGPSEVTEPRPRRLSPRARLWTGRELELTLTLLVLTCTTENLFCPPPCSTPQSKGGGEGGGLRGARRSSRAQEDTNKRHQKTIITLLIWVNTQETSERRLHTLIYQSSSAGLNPFKAFLMSL